MQLIKQIDGQNHFWLFEKDGRTLYTFHGIMGERLEEPMSEQKFSRFFNLDAYIRELVAEKEKTVTPSFKKQITMRLSSKSFVRIQNMKSSLSIVRISKKTFIHFFFKSETVILLRMIMVRKPSNSSFMSSNHLRSSNPSLNILRNSMA